VAAIFAEPHYFSEYSVQQRIQAVLSELNRVILGKEEEIQLAVCCLLAKGHLLIEDAAARYTPKNNEAPQKWQPQAPVSIEACGERPGRLATAEDA
jgi:hypothetical protein